MIPAGIYLLSYLPVFGIKEGFLAEVFRYQKMMYHYHSTLVASHPYESLWYEWPVMLRPVWYHVTSAVQSGDGLAHSIAAFGNPVVWWGALPAILIGFLSGIRRRDRRAAFLAAGYCSVYLPWIVVPRLTFIYHYYMAVPFAVLSIVYCLCCVLDKAEKMPLKDGTKRCVSEVAIWALPVAATVLFILFVPVVFGAGAPEWYLEILEWLPGWTFI